MVQNSGTQSPDEAFTYAESKEEEAARQKEASEAAAKAVKKKECKGRWDKPLWTMPVSLLATPMFGEVQALQMGLTAPDLCSLCSHFESVFHVQRGIWRM